jgi:hypothetical protein
MDAREIALSYAVDHSTISRLKTWHAAARWLSRCALPPGVEAGVAQFRHGSDETAAASARL